MIIGRELISLDHPAMVIAKSQIVAKENNGYHELIQLGAFSNFQYQANAKNYSDNNLSYESFP